MRVEPALDHLLHLPTHLPTLPMTQATTAPLALHMPAPSASELKAARVAAGLSQVQAAELMGYPVQQGSRGGLQSRTWQALESESDERTMQGPVFAMFLLLTGQHPTHALENKANKTNQADTPQNVAL